MTDSARPRDGGGKGSRPDAVFDGLPHGALVLDADGSVLSINPPAAELLGHGPAAPGARCCELLGCGKPGSQLESGCVTNLAGRPGEVSPELRVDLARGASSGSAWVAARRLTDGRIVVQVRPGDGGDRRATIAEWKPDRYVTIRALGRTEVRVGETPADQTWIRQRPGQLLKLLVTERWRAVTTTEIAEALWPGVPSGRGPTVRSLVHHLRRRLDGDAGREATTSIARLDGGYRLRPERVAVDVDAFEAAADDGLQDRGGGRRAEARGSLERAMALYRGHYMAEDAYADWSIRERERLRAIAGQVARALVDLQVGDGRLEAAGATARRLQEIDPFDADVQRRTVALSLVRGRRSEAVRSYEVIRAQMLRNFGEPPEFTLLDVADPSSVWPGLGR